MIAPLVRKLKDWFRHPSSHDYFSHLSDGDFCLSLAGFLRIALGPRDLEYWKAFLNEDIARRPQLVHMQLNHCFDRQAREAVQLCDPFHVWVAGTQNVLTPEAWKERAAELQLFAPRERQPVPLEKRRFAHSGHYVVSAIASLYKGRRYLESFLDNITSQTIFDRSELIIIDADSPEGEGEMIAEYQKVYPNIVYRRMDYRIRIYDAWNVGIRMARGRYLTNTNLDDLRRSDSFELQAAALDRHDFADVTYQEFFYSLDGTFDFEEVAQFGFKSALPCVTPNSLLGYNAPHNAPMWRKSLHDEMGLFDTSYESAGDYEFWLRCLAKGKQFIKVSAPHVVYFQNPAGVSTRSDSKGVEEGRKILAKYGRELISRNLLVSRREFAKLLGIAPDWNSNMSYYDVAQRQLASLRERLDADAQNAVLESASDLSRHGLSGIPDETAC